MGQCIRQAADGRTWLVRTLWGLRDQEAGWIGAEILNSNGSHDLGPLQVNSFWIPKLAVMVDRPPAQVRTWLAHDPCFNVQAARWIFLSALSATRDYWKAVGVYHSPTDWRRRRYAQSVAAHMKMRFGSTIFAATQTVRGSSGEGGRP
ncbi:lytic transglycosylase domain-containing protein [Sphingobium sp. EM0848]|uniref:lytic transglycosylase domain-containing protein n=1 Tax=Sphingobium sp. EM0848 TaxID=2743473 RepID=UPI00350F475C